MKTTLATLSLFAAALTCTSFPFDRKGSSPAGAATAATKERRVQYAAWDDVNVIAHGLLQLGQGLKEHVDKTKVQMRDVSGQLKALNRTVAELGKESRRLRAEGEALALRARGLEEREGQLLNVTAALRERAEELQLERRAAGARLGRLEEKVDSVLQGRRPDARNASDARHVQLMLEAQNRRIDDLLERIRLQQEKLDKQNVRIRTLQSQVQQSRRSSSGTDTSAEQRDAPAETPSDCHELFLRGEATSGVYVIQPRDAEPFEVFCEMNTDGGWTVIQRRQDGSADFDRLWEDYERGFGDLNGEFWLGLQKIHSVARAGGYVLRVKLADWKGEMASIRLPFSLGGRDSRYSLWVPTGEDLSPPQASLDADTSAGLPFSTRDRDNDGKGDVNCAKQLSGGWWFSNCGRSNLNGRYFQSPPPKQRHQRKQGIFWKSWRGRYYPLKSSVMMIAPAAAPEAVVGRREP